MGSLHCNSRDCSQLAKKVSRWPIAPFPSIRICFGFRISGSAGLRSSRLCGLRERGSTACFVRTTVERDSQAPTLFQHAHGSRHRTSFFKCVAHENRARLATALQLPSCPVKSVSCEEIIEAWKWLCDLDETEAGLQVKKFMDEQPALGVYLFANMEELAGEAEDTRIVELVLTAWQAMSKSAGQQLPGATPEEIECAEDANIRTLEQLDEGSEFEWQNTVPNLFQDYNQREILVFGIEILMSGNEDTPELAPEGIGLEMVWLKTVIDVLDR